MIYIQWRIVLQIFRGKREIDRLILNYDILCNFWLFACADGSRGRTFSVPFTFLMPEMCIFKFRSNRVVKFSCGLNFPISVFKPIKRTFVFFLDRFRKIIE